MQSLVGARILIVDSDLLLMVHLAQELVELGALVPIGAPSLSRAIVAARDPHIDAAVVDPILYDSDGASVVLALVARGIPTVVTSLFSLTTLPADIAACSFVRKPYDPRQVVTAVADTMAGRHVVHLEPHLVQPDGRSDPVDRSGR